MNEQKAIEPDEDVDAPLDELEMLAQRYVDGASLPGEAERVEQLLEEDPAFADLVGGYASLFSALDRHAYEAPADLASNAVASWSAAASPVPAGWLQVFGGMRRGVGVFVALDAVLATLLVGLLVARGPVALLKSWVLGLKDVVVWASHLVPSAEVAAALVPALMLLCVALLGAVVFGLRTLLVRAEVPR
jgi:anti-sigma factor RsiW